MPVTVNPPQAPHAGSSRILPKAVRRRCIRRVCQQVFVTLWADKMYCTRLCKTKEANERSRRKHPDQALWRSRFFEATHKGRARRSVLKCRYGMTVDDFNALLEKQNNVCAICSLPFGHQTPRVDHDHKTGAVRGLLHIECNWGLGNFKDDIAVLKRAIEYLEASRK